MKIGDYQRYTRNKKKISTEAKSSKCRFNDISNKYICISNHIDNPVIRDINKIIENMKNTYFDIEVSPRLVYHSSQKELRVPLYKINFKNIKRISELKSTKLFKISNTYCKHFKLSRMGTYEN